MSKNRLHITSQVPSLEQMDRYLKGELTEAERKMFEEAMKDDPFLQDAMEGLNMVEDGQDVKAAVKRIKKESFKRASIKAKKRDQLGKRRSRVGPQNYTTLIISSAAAITLLLVSVFLIQQRSNRSPSDTIAQTQAAPATAEEGPSITPQQPESSENIVSGILSDSLEEEDTDLIADARPEPEKKEALVIGNNRAEQNKDFQIRAHANANTDDETSEPLPEENVILDESPPVTSAPRPDINASSNTPGREAAPAVSKPSGKAVDTENEEIASNELDDFSRVTADTIPRLKAEELEAIPLSSSSADSKLIAQGDKVEKSNRARSRNEKRKKDNYSLNKPREQVLAEQAETDKAFGKASRDAILNDLLVKSVQLHRDSAYDESLELLKEVLQSDSQNPTANYYAGNIYRSYGQLKSATSHLTIATAQSNSDYYNIAQWELALTLLARGKKKAAAKVLNNIVEEKSEYSNRAQQMLDEL